MKQHYTGYHQDKTNTIERMNKEHQANKARKLSSLAELSGIITFDQVTEHTNEKSIVERLENIMNYKGPDQPTAKAEPVNTGGLWATIRSAEPAKFMPSSVTMEDLNDIANTLKENTDKRLKDQHKANLDTFKHLPQFGKE